MWALVRRQHGVIAQRQLRALGYSESAIRHRVAAGRLHPLWPGVYAVATPYVTPEGTWMAAVLTCGEGACLSHESAARLWGIRPPGRGPVHVTVTGGKRPRRTGILVHRRTLAPAEATTHDGIPVTAPATTIADLAPALSQEDLERAIGQADVLGRIDPERLRRQLDRMPPRPGVGIAKRVLDRHTFVLTHSELERLLVPIALRVGIGPPEGQRRVGRYRVDFLWPSLGLVVEVDGLTYHRTAAQQTADLRRDQAHVAAGRVPLRFSHAQVRFAEDEVEAVLAAVARRLGRTAPAASP